MSTHPIHPLSPGTIPRELARMTLTKAIANCGRSQRAVARAVGLKPNMLSMICNGRVPLPLEHVSALARELAVDECAFSLQAVRDTNAVLFRELWPILVLDRFEAAVLEVNRIRRRRAGLTSTEEVPATTPADVVQAALSVKAKTLVAIGREIDVAANVVSMMKTGEMAVPIDRARALARSLEVKDEIIFLHQVLRAARPAFYDAIKSRLAADRLEAGLLLVSRRQQLEAVAA
jgi:transcriptional regulator with XRE-family HTH domain